MYVRGQCGAAKSAPLYTSNSTMYGNCDTFKAYSRLGDTPPILFSCGFNIIDVPLRCSNISYHWCRRRSQSLSTGGDIACRLSFVIGLIQVCNDGDNDAFVLHIQHACIIISRHKA